MPSRPIIWLQMTGFPSFFSFMYVSVCIYTHSGKESPCQCRRCKRHGFDPWVGKSWRRKWQPAPVFLPGNFHAPRSLAGYMGLKRVRHNWATEHTHTYTYRYTNIHIYIYGYRWFNIYIYGYRWIYKYLYTWIYSRCTYLIFFILLMWT